MSFVFIISMLFGSTWAGRMAPKVTMSALPLFVLKADKEKEGLDQYYKLLDGLGLSLEDDATLRAGGLQFFAVILTEKFVREHLEDKTGAMNGAIGKKLLLTEREHFLLMSTKVDPENPASYPDKLLQVSQKRLRSARFLRAAGFTRASLKEAFAKLQ